MSVRKIEARMRLAGTFRRLLNSLILHPDALEFAIKESRVGIKEALIVTIRPHAADFTRLYGKGRSMFLALQTVAVSIGQCCGYEVQLGYLEEPHPGEKDRLGGYNDWAEGREKYLALMLDVCGAIFNGRPPKVELDDKDEALGLVAKITVEQDTPYRLQGKAEALQTISKAFCAKYGRMPTVQLITQ